MVIDVRSVTTSGLINTHLAELPLCCFILSQARRLKMVPMADIAPVIYFLLAIVAPALLPLNMEVEESIIRYNR